MQDTQNFELSFEISRFHLLQISLKKLCVGFDFQHAFPIFAYFVFTVAEKEKCLLIAASYYKVLNFPLMFSLV